MNESVLFNAVVKLPKEQRQAFLDAACAGDPQLRAGVEGLLQEHDGAGSFMGRPAAAQPATDLFRPITEGPGSIIGPYKLREQIGEGGFGVVYVAEQEKPVRRKVALKIIKPGMDTKDVIARFEAERQALALMDHPNVARVLDAGATESGRPYFVMELVQGVTITEFCDKNSLPTRERLKLFVDVCRAVQHAHQKGIIHRDLKPANIMVTLHDGQPVAKVIDFGVSKALSQQLTEKSIYTAYGQMIGTPSYMSPEQAEMSGLGIDTRSDIYSLGVLLYELLTGKTPLDAKRLRNSAYAEILRIIREEEPQRPSLKISTLGDEATVIAQQRHTDPKQLRRDLRGDLDWIVLKCLEKDRARRYETATGLARDIEHYLSDEPVEACPPSAGYRLRKLLRRHRGPVLAASLIFLLLVAGIVGTTVGLMGARQQRDAAELARRNEAREKDRAVAAEKLASNRLVQVETEKRRADQEAAVAKAVNEFLTEDLLGQVSSFAQAEREFEPDPDIKVRTLVGRSAQAIEGKFRDQPIVEAGVRRAIGQAYRALGDYSQSILHITRAAALQRAALGPDHPETLTSNLSLVFTLHCVGRNDEAITLAEQVRDQRIRLLGPDHPDTLTSLSLLAIVLQGAGRTADAIALGEQVRDQRTRILGPDHRDTLVSLHNLGWSYGSAGRTAEAIALLEQLRERQIRVWSPDHPIALHTFINLAYAYKVAGRTSDALALFEEVIPKARRVLGSQHLRTISYTQGWAQTLDANRQFARACEIRLELLAVERALYPADDPRLAQALASFGYSLVSDGKSAECESVVREALTIAEAKMPDDWQTFNWKRLLGRALMAQKKNAQAEPLLVQGYEGLLQRQDKIPLESRARLTDALNSLVQLYNDWGKLDKAVYFCEESLRILTAKLGPDHADTLTAMSNLANAYRINGRLAEAIPLYEETLKLRRAKLGNDDADTLTSLGYLADAYRDYGRLDGAVPLFEERIRLRTAKQGAGHVSVADAKSGLGETLLLQRKYAEAESLLRDGLTVREKERPGSWGVAYSQSSLGAALAGQQKYAEAEPLLVAGYEGLKSESNIPALYRNFPGKALERLVQLYEAWGKPDEAAKWRMALDEYKTTEAPAVDSTVRP